MHHCEGWVGTETGMGTGGDGSQCIREWVGMGGKGASSGGNLTKIPSVFRPLVPIVYIDFELDSDLTYVDLDSYWADSAMLLLLVIVIVMVICC